MRKSPNACQPWPILRTGLVLASVSFLAIFANPHAAKGEPRVGQDYPAVPTASAEAPNVVLVLTDDTGFGVSSAFGGPVPTPTLERLASDGLSYTRFHTTAMCSPTRASLLTGRNHHRVRTGTLTDFASGYSGYNGFIPKSAGTIAELLKTAGYNTAMFGKHHNVPIGQHSAAGPFDLWPTGLGFEYFFGFLQSDTDQWHPNLFRGVSRVEEDDKREVLDKRLADDAIRWIHNQKAAAPEKPFFVYFATGSSHTPHQAPAEWIQKFQGRFSAGWNVVREQTLDRQIKLGLVPTGTKLAPWSPDIPMWSRLSPEAREVQERYMEAFAGMVAYQDAQIGHVLDEIDRMGLKENTLVIFIQGDNGTDAAGSPEGSVTEVGEIINQRLTLDERVATLGKTGTEFLQTNFGSGWALAMNSPFPYYKQMASHLGGTRNGMVVSWPRKIKLRGVRSQYHHVIDIMPTILEIAGIPAPPVIKGIEQQAIDGISLRYTFDNAAAPGRRRTQYYEMLGNRAIYHDGWLANTTPQRLPWHMAHLDERARTNQAPEYAWELYNLQRDFSQSQNLAMKNSAKLAELKKLFEKEASANDVNPVDDRTSPNRYGGTYNHYLKQYDRYTFWGKDISVAMEAAPQLGGRSFIVDAELNSLSAGASGVVAAAGSRFGGWSFILRNGRPAVVHVLAPSLAYHFELTSRVAIGPGKARLRYEFIADGGDSGTGGLVRISVDGRKVAEQRIEKTITMAGGVGETFDVGLDRGVPVADGFSNRGRLEGDIDKLSVHFPAAAAN